MEMSDVTNLFLENDLIVGQAQVVEGYVDDILKACDEGPWYGEVLVIVPPFKVVK